MRCIADNWRFLAGTSDILCVEWKFNISFMLSKICVYVLSLQRLINVIFWIFCSLQFVNSVTWFAWVCLFANCFHCFRMQIFVVLLCLFLYMFAILAKKTTIFGFVFAPLLYLSGMFALLCSFRMFVWDFGNLYMCWCSGFEIIIASDGCDCCRSARWVVCMFVWFGFLFFCSFFTYFLLCLFVALCVKLPPDRWTVCCRGNVWFFFAVIHIESCLVFFAAFFGLCCRAQITTRECVEAVRWVHACRYTERWM